MGLWHVIISGGAQTFRLLCIIAGIAAVGIGCGPLPAPVVDMEGVDQVKYNRDLAACYEEKRLTIEMGNAVSNCMKAKGYTILVSH